MAVSVAALLSFAPASPAGASMLAAPSDPASQPGQTTEPIAAKKALKPQAMLDANGQPVPFQDGQYPGKAFDAYYGLVQVQANINGGKLESVDVLQWPSHRRTSQYINAQAIPVLQQEVISAQNTQVDLVSGATLTSEAFLRSLNSALSQASN